MSPPRKDPSAPKKPLTGFAFFCKSKRATVTKEIGSTNFGEVSKELAKRWMEADAETKAIHMEESKVDTLRYKAEMDKYHPPVATDDDLKNTDDDLKKPPARSVKEMKSVRSKPELPSLENIFSGSLKTKPFRTPFNKSKVGSSEGERRKKCKTGDSSHSFMSASDDDEDKDGKKGGGGEDGVRRRSNEKYKTGDSSRRYMSASDADEDKDGKKGEGGEDGVRRRSKSRERSRSCSRRRYSRSRSRSWSAGKFNLQARSRFAKKFFFFFNSL